MGTLILTMLFTLSSFADSALSGKQAAELYQSVLNESRNICSAKKCEVAAYNLLCLWENERDWKKSTSCSFTDQFGAKKEVVGARAHRIAKAVLDSTKLEPSCGMGRCGFDELRNLSCTEVRGKGKRDLQHKCTISAVKTTCLSAGEQDRMAALQAKLKEAIKSRPGCERSRAGCLSQADKIALDRLKARESSGCRSPAHPAPSGADPSSGGSAR